MNITQLNNEKSHAILSLCNTNAIQTKLQQGDLYKRLVLGKNEIQIDPIISFSVNIKMLNLC